MTVKLYHYYLSAPSRGALLAARLVGAPVKVEIVNLMNKEQLQEKFVKINPQHCVPTLDDNGFILWESRAIACYLADKYGKDEYYPKDLKSRALVNSRLHFDGTSLYVKIRAIFFPILFLGETEVKESMKNDLNITLGYLDQFLSVSKWVAGDSLTIADTSMYSSFSNLLAVGWDVSKFTNIQRWVEQCTSLPGFQENEEGAKAFGDVIKKNLKK